MINASRDAVKVQTNHARNWRLAYENENDDI